MTQWIRKSQPTPQDVDRPLTSISLFLCPSTWHAFLSAVEDLRPDIVYLNGDIILDRHQSNRPTS